MALSAPAVEVRSLPESRGKLDCDVSIFTGIVCRKRATKLVFRANWAPHEETATCDDCLELLLKKWKNAS